MENKGLIDFIGKLQAAAGFNKNSGETTKNSGETTKNTGEEKQADQETSAQKSKPVPDEKSFMRSYNPFAESVTNRPQVTAPRAKKPPKEKIDLAASKNLAGSGGTEVKNNMIDLINKHNRILSKLKGRNAD